MLNCWLVIVSSQMACLLYVYRPPARLLFVCPNIYPTPLGGKLLFNTRMVNYYTTRNLCKLAIILLAGILLGTLILQGLFQTNLNHVKPILELSAVFNICAGVLGFLESKNPIDFIRSNNLQNTITQFLHDWNYASSYLRNGLNYVHNIKEFWVVPIIPHLGALEILERVLVVGVDHFIVLTASSWGGCWVWRPEIPGSPI